MSLSIDETLEARIGPLLRQRGWKLALAESCTGGLAGHRITNVPGSSDYFQGSIVAYSYEAKERLLGVRRETLERYGAVSRETVLEMARGACRALDAQVALSVSGIAGPGGGLPHKPVGTVWVGLCAPDGEWAFRFLWDGDRLQNKAYSAQALLQILADYLEGKSPRGAV